MRVGSKVLYRNKHKGEVIGFTHYYMEQVVIVKFEERWKYDMSDDKTMYCHANELKKIRLRIFTKEDPYGEENWYE